VGTATTTRSAAALASSARRGCGAASTISPTATPRSPFRQRRSSSGTADPAADAEIQRRLGPVKAHLAAGPRVWGELFAFDDPEARLPALDHLEGFDPGDRSSPYRRVLVPVETASNDRVPAWAYVVEAASGVHLPEGRWPA